MSATDQPSEDELRAAYEAEIKKIRVEQIVLEQVVTLINLGMRRTGLQPGTEDERDPAQVRVAIEGVRALLPLVEEGVGADQADAIREALSQLQLAYVRLGGQDPASPAPPFAGGSAPGPDEGGAEPSTAGPAPGAGGQAGSVPPQPGPEPGADGGPAQRSGRLWVPGQR